MGSISTTITLCSEVERLLRVFGESVQEKLQKGIDIFPSELARIHLAAIFGIRETDVNGLVEEDDIGMGVPAVGIECCIVTAIRDTAGTKLEQKPSRGATARAAVQPQDQWCILWRIARLEEPVEQIKASWP